MKKILLLTTTPTLGGNGDALMEAAEEAAKECGAEVTRLNVRELDIHLCRGCYGCAATGECVQKDDFRRVLNALHECEGLIAEAPIYYNCMAARRCWWSTACAARSPAGIIRWGRKRRSAYCSPAPARMRKN